MLFFTAKPRQNTSYTKALYQSGTVCTQLKAPNTYFKHAVLKSNFAVLLQRQLKKSFGTQHSYCMFSVDSTRKTEGQTNAAADKLRLVCNGNTLTWPNKKKHTPKLY